MAEVWLAVYGKQESLLDLDIRCSKCFRALRVKNSFGKSVRVDADCGCGAYEYDRGFEAGYEECKEDYNLED